jgi:hypothetical protein
MKFIGVSWFDRYDAHVHSLRRSLKLEAERWSFSRKRREVAIATGTNRIG